MPTRIESDGFGEIAVPSEHHWGAQTQRSLGHFAIGAERMPAPLIAALALVKKVAAGVNRDLGLLAPDIAAKIDAAARVVAIFMNQIPLFGAAPDASTAYRPRPRSAPAREL